MILYFASVLCIWTRQLDIFRIFSFCPVFVNYEVLLAVWSEDFVYSDNIPHRGVRLPP